MDSKFISPYHISKEHSFHRRAFAHNYRAPFIYHLILKKEKGAPSFGSVKGNALIEFGKAGCASIERTPLGQIIFKAIFNFHTRFPIIQIYQFVVMPDHVHILLRVKNWSPYHLDYYIESLQQQITHQYHAATGISISEPRQIFENGYCDKPLLLNRSLSALFEYIRKNPHRLAIRMQYPQFFRRVTNLKIGDNEYEAYGNLFLIENPDKEAVKISRSFSEEEKRRKRELWLSESSRGTILVSPFISKEEKQIMIEAEKGGGGIILICHEAFPERFKPAEHNFELCSSGRLLIISLGMPSKSALTREICNRMNELASEIAGH